MVRRSLVPVFIALGLLAPASGQDRRPRIDVDHYRIDAEIHPNTQSLTARVLVQFTPQEDTSSAIFELNNGLNVARVFGEKNEEIPATRYQQDFTVRLNFPSQLPKGKPVTATFIYDGRLNGIENSPVEGVSFASIGTDRAFL